MQSLATLLAWTCMGLVALPLSPCAVVWQICDLGGTANRFSAGASVIAEDAANGADQPDAPKSCCHERADAHAKNTSDQEPVAPCPLGCCRLIPVGPTVEKVAAEQSLTIAAFLPCPLANAIGGRIAPAQEPLLPAQTLQSLSCLWRC